MSVVVTFEDYRPSAREDGQPWTEARIEEATLETGPWTTVETLTLDPVDEDPAAPLERSFTTTLGTVTDGFYRVVFLDELGDEEVTAAKPYPPPVSIRPSLDDIGALLHARTAAGGTEVGTFDSTTRPTGEEVERLISIAADDLRARVGTTIPDIYLDEARRLVSLQTAALVEASFFPHEIDTDRSAYRQYTAMYLNAVEALRARVGATTGSGSATTMALTTPTAEYSDELGLQYEPPDIWV